MTKKGFTLLELVIVIGILAILGAISVLVLNPAQLLAQARDTTRIQDLGNLNSALGLYVATVSSPNLGGAGSCSANCFASVSGTGSGCAGAGAARHGTKTQGASVTRAIDGTGWLPVNFTALPTGAPLATLPVDPVNSTTYFYSYACDSTAQTYVLNANLESERYMNGGADDRESTDGGTKTGHADLYEIGTAADLNL